MQNTITTTKRHPLVDIFLAAGLLADEVLGRNFPYSFANSVAKLLSSDVAVLKPHLDAWVDGVQREAAARSPHFAATATSLISHVKLCFDVATSSPLTTSNSSESLYVVYLDNFIEYLTPSGKDGIARHGHNDGDATKLRAQAQGIADAIVVDHDTCECVALPRGFDEFCELLGLDEKKLPN